ncbi:hypothetical protein FA13DRAFT_1734632 [Coprinellus micaceus]|uniref:Uncharacterized protein n=1 Tax=Coprinellus micaceus TaxID=71717 RepID=A0A4Y7T7C0_COPMI|nr:hypothetical protein FA13DRAFT_1734632 [Coprinellus micaceus]
MTRRGASILSTKQRPPTPPAMGREIQVGGALPKQRAAHLETMPSVPLPTPPQMERSTNRRPTHCRRLSASWCQRSTLPTNMPEHLPLKSAKMESLCPTLTADEISGYCADWEHDEGESDLDGGSVWSEESLSRSMSSGASQGLGARGRSAVRGLHGLLGCVPPMMEKGYE